MTFPATIAAATPLNLSSVNTRVTPTLPCACSCDSSSLFTVKNLINRRSDRRLNRISPVKSAASDSTAIADNPIVASTSEEDEIQAKVGARVRVTVPLKVYHVPKVPEVDLNGMEGKLKEYVAVWKGKHISANFPYKIEFFEKLEGRGDAPVKFFAHLKEDEFVCGLT
ncbi:putative ferredoxin:thioredoxin reductase [Helianthus annuus]|nr:putative ferredoxin:thioredoxin reductase [Helianthus annuus]KAJ0448921.1 putative ferredoxin:thioredoxin reductase [Helianthus annuus]KAJ0633794.1 putative ferredoxin:thioredoxin reductase [Helianthus annuus]